MIDVVCAAALYSFALGGVVAYSVRAALRGRARNARLASEGSAMLGRSVMEAAYWVFGPIVSLLHRLGVTPNMVTAASLVPALLAGIAAAAGHFGVAALLATASSFCDMLDGLLARRLGTSSDAGEVFDAAVDRYVEFSLLAGLVVHYRAQLPLQVVGLGAILGSFMVSYATAKAETLNVTPPKGAMRRAERAVYVLGGTALAPLWGAAVPTPAAFLAGPELAAPELAAIVWRDLPLVLAVTVVATVANVSAARRFHRTAQLVRMRDAGRATPPKAA